MIERRAALGLAPGCIESVPRARRGVRGAKAPQTCHLSDSCANPSRDEPKGSGSGSASAPGDSERGARDLPGDVRTFPRRALHPETQRARISDYFALSDRASAPESDSIQTFLRYVIKKALLEA